MLQKIPERGLETGSRRQLPFLGIDSSARSLGQLLQFKLSGSTGFEVCTLFIQIAVNAFEVGDFLPDLRHLLFNEFGAVSTINRLVPLRIQDLAYFPSEKPMLCARWIKVRSFRVCAV